MFKMSRKSLAVIGYGNMAKAIVGGILKCESNISNIIIFDINTTQYASYVDADIIKISDSMESAIRDADSVLLSVKPQNFSEILPRIKEIPGYQSKLYISIAAGISTESICDVLGDVSVIRVLPNIPMTIGQGVSVICRNSKVVISDFDYVKDIFSRSGSVLEIDENEINRFIGVTSSAPAYVFKFIDAICKGAEAQGIDYGRVLGVVCDMLIGSAMMLKCGELSPEELISRVASKGGTTERALSVLNERNFSGSVVDAMKACTDRAEELGQIK